MDNEPISEETLLLDDLEGDTRNTARCKHIPRHISLRIGAAMYSFVILGLFQSSVGVMLQPLSEYYSLSDVYVSFVFVVGPVGYIIAAQFSDMIHRTYGQRGVAIFAPALHISGALVIASHPRFGIVLVAHATVALGLGLLDVSWCAWAASLENANLVSGLLQGAFSVGAAAGPFFASIVLRSYDGPWYDWYCILASASVVELCISLFAFGPEDALQYHEAINKSAPLSRGKIFEYSATRLSALYLFVYVGLETAISGWIVSFMLRYRGATPYLANMASTAFWSGMTVSRFSLGAVTDRLGVGPANSLYLLITIACQLIFACVSGPSTSVVLMASIGFFVGPMFASGVVILTRLLPVDLHVIAVSCVASAGQIGAALLPFLIGVLIKSMGISIFRVAMVVLTIGVLFVWIPISRQRPAKNHVHEDEPRSGDIPGRPHSH